MSQNKISVVKVPNENKSSSDETIEHPRVPYMYLELLENKDKIKSEVVNRDYDPSDTVSLKSFNTNTSNTIKPKNNNNSFDKIEEEAESDISISEDEESIEESEGVENDDMSIEQPSSIEDEEESMQDSESSQQQNTENKLKAMLDDDYHSSSAAVPPKLSDLQKQGVLRNERTIPNISMLDEEDEEDDEDKKRELLFKFSLLKKSYNTQIDIPEFTIHSNYKTMVNSYEQCLRHLSLESSVDQYKNCLIAGFMICEYVFGVYLNLDMAGYTQAQILNLAQYERLLIELGSKNYTPQAENYPVEFRLIGMILLNAVLFVVSKLILKKTGNNIMEMCNQNVRNKYTESYENSTNNFFQQNQTQPQEDRKKMKRPSFDFSSL